MKKYNCISKDVKQLISKSHSAHNDLYKFIDQLDFNSKENELKFHTEVEKNLDASHLTDAIEIIRDSKLLVEFMDENNKEIIKSTTNMIMSEIIESHGSQHPLLKHDDGKNDLCIDTVLGLMDEAKSDDKHSGSKSFVMKRIVPGLFLFLDIHTYRFTHKKLFTKNEVIAFGIQFKVVLSESDIVRETKFNSLKDIKEEFIRIKELQKKLVEQLTNNEIDINEWMRRDSEYKILGDQVKVMLDKYQ